MLFGSTLRMLRTTAGISLREMARKIQVSPAYLSQIETGNLAPPTFDRIEKIAKVFGIPSNFLLELSKRLNPDTLTLLQSHPQLTRFIEMGGKIGLNPTDFQFVSAVLEELGLEGFRNLLKYGHEHLSEFKPKRFSESFHGDFQKNYPNIQFRKSINPDLVFPHLLFKDKKKVLHYLVKKSCLRYPTLDAGKVFDMLMASEAESTSGIGNNVAFPHLFLEDIDKRILSIGRIPGGIDFEATDNKPVYLVCLILDTKKDHQSHLKLLAYLARQFQNPELSEEIQKAKTKEQILSLVFDVRPISLN